MLMVFGLGQSTRPAGLNSLLSAQKWMC